MLKIYPKTYENVFSTDRPGNNTKLNIAQVTVGDTPVEEYVSLFQDFLNKFYLQLFDNCVRLSWLRRQFTYYGHKTKMPMSRNSRIHHSAFVKVLRRYVGKDIQIITRAKFFAKLETYFDELFPGFDDGNPFENPEYYKFPFKNISVEYLSVVHQLDDRVAILEYADKKKMSYAVFLDFVINHVSCANEEFGRDKYEIRNNTERNFSFYIRDNDKKLPVRKTST
jgi:hypothetical protein